MNVGRALFSWGAVVILAILARLTMILPPDSSQHVGPVFIWGCILFVATIWFLLLVNIEDVTPRQDLEFAFFRLAVGLIGGTLVVIAARATIVSGASAWFSLIVSGVVVIGLSALGD